MPRFKYINRKITTAALLGVLALIVNAISYYTAWPQLIPVGNLFLFWSASALGPLSGFLSFATGVLPEVLWSHDTLYGARMLILLVVLGFAAERFPRVPGFVVVLALWMMLFAPVEYVLGLSQLVPSSNVLADSIADPHRIVGIIFLAAVADVLLALLSSTLLLHPSLWVGLTNRPRPLSATTVLVPVTVLLTTTAMLGAVTLSWSHGMGFVSSIERLSSTNAFLLAFLGIIAPAVLAWWISTLMPRYCQDLFPSSATKPHGFSGLSSEYWRRKSSTNLARSSAGNEGSSSTLSRVHPVNSVLGSDRGICAVDRSGVISFVNRKFLSLTDCSAQEVLGKNLREVGMNETFRAHLEHLIERTFTKGPRSTELKVNQLPDKLRFYEVVSMRSEALEHSSIAHGPDIIVIAVKDITERRTVESHLLQAQKLDSLGTLVGGIAHAFNNSLTAIMGQASLAQSATDPQRTQHALAAILSASHDAGTLVNQLLDFAEGRPSLVEASDLGALIQDRVGLLQKLVGESYEVVFERSNPSIPVTCDTNLIMQAITNLVLNSKESYGQLPGKISIMLETEHFDDDVEDVQAGASAGDFARLRVRDSGSGMTPEVLSRAFDPLFTTKSSTGHTGLGLSIVFAIVRAHGGFLTVESKPDRGTTVSVYLPLAKERSVGDPEAAQTSAEKGSEPESLGASSVPPTRPSRGARVLVVEDEPHVRELLSLMLDELGYRVESCGDGAEALARCERDRFDLVVVDLVLPKINGLEVIARIQESNAHVRTILMSGYGETLDRSRAVDAKEATGYLSKPFDLIDLQRAIAEALRDLRSSGAHDSPYMM